MYENEEHANKKIQIAWFEWFTWKTEANAGKETRVVWWNHLSHQDSGWCLNCLHYLIWWSCCWKLSRRFDWCRQLLHKNGVPHLVKHQKLFIAAQKIIKSIAIETCSPHCSKVMDLSTGFSMATGGKPLSIFIWPAGIWVHLESSSSSSPTEFWRLRELMTDWPPLCLTLSCIGLSVVEAITP